MKPRHQNRRLGIFAICAVIAITGTVLLLSALSKNTQFFYNPGDVLQDGFAPKSPVIRIGGLVSAGSVSKGDQLQVDFTVEDFEDHSGKPLAVSYNGILPDLFREGEGVVITGKMAGDELIASEILAKHDNEYRPKMPEKTSVYAD